MVLCSLSKRVKDEVRCSIGVIRSRSRVRGVSQQPNDKPPAKFSISLQYVTAILAGFATLLGAWSTHQSVANGDALNNLRFAKQNATDFAAAISQARPYFANPKAQIESMIEVSRLWAVADSVQEKLVLFEIAKVSQQNRATDVLKVLATGDAQLHPADKSSRDAIAINAFNSELLSIVDSGSRSPSSSDRAALSADASPLQPVSVRSASPPASSASPTPETPTAPLDVALTKSTNSAVATSARLIVALGQAKDTTGWVFLGDALDSKGGAAVATAFFEPGTATSSTDRPVTAGDFITCSDLNLRASPCGTQANISSANS